MKHVLVLLAAWGAASIAVRFVAGPGDAVWEPFRPEYSAVVATFAGLLVLARAWTAPQARTAWALVGGGVVLWHGADVLTLDFGVVGVEAMLYFRAVYAAALVLLGAGLLLVVRAKRPPADRSVRLDALAVGLGVAALVTWLGIDPVRDAIGDDAPAVATVLHFTLVTCDALLLVIAVCGFVLLRWRLDRTWVLATLGAGLFIAAEIGYAVGSAAGTWSPAMPTNAGWSASAVLLAWAAWAPSAWRADDRPVHGELRDVLLPFAFSLASVALLAASGPLGVGTVPAVLAAASLCAGLVRLLLTALEHGALLRATQIEARTDPLTGLGNRRQLTDDLDAALDEPERSSALVLFDLDGFKGYNDHHGHPAGDALLVALGGVLASEVGIGRAYRLGGDEFCALVTAPDGGLDGVVADAAAALAIAATDAGIGSSHGAVHLHAEASEASAALRIADRRLYGEKARRGTLRAA